MDTHVEKQGTNQLSQRFVAELAKFSRKNGLQLGIIGVMAAIWILFVVEASDTFLSREIYGALMLTIPYWGVIALPLTMVVIAGEMDLSFPSVMAMGMVAFIEVLNETASVELAVLGALATGFLIGLLNGLIVVKIGLPSLIATIGTMFFWRGAVHVIRSSRSATLGESLFVVRDSSVREFLVGTINDYWPKQMLWMVLVAIITWIILNRHKLGAHVYLIGDNENSARLMGVNTDRTKMLVFGIVGLAAAFGGVLSSLQVNYFWPTLGEGYLMTTLAAVFLGGTSVFGGRGTILGTFVGCLIIGAIEPGIVAIGLTGFWTQLIYGLIITSSVAMHTILSKRME